MLYVAIWMHPYQAPIVIFALCHALFVGEGGEITRRPLEGFPREGAGGRHNQGKENLCVFWISDIRPLTSRCRWMIHMFCVFSFLLICIFIDLWFPVSLFINTAYRFCYNQCFVYFLETSGIILRHPRDGVSCVSHGYLTSFWSPPTLLVILN